MEVSNDQMLEWKRWREAQRAKHRFMTPGEYVCWRSGGDEISSPSEANPFPGGLTIAFGPSIIGRSDEAWESSPLDRER